MNCGSASARRFKTSLLLHTTCVCCFVLLNRYWGIVMYGPGASSWASQVRRTHDPRSPTSQPHPVPFFHNLGCPDPVTVPDVIGGLAVWRHITVICRVKKKLAPQYLFNKTKQHTHWCVYFKQVFYLLFNTNISIILQSRCAFTVWLSLQTKA